MAGCLCSQDKETAGAGTRRGLELRKLSSGACDGHTAKQSRESWLTRHLSAPAGMRLLKPKLQLGSVSLLLPLNGNQYFSPCRRRLLAEPGCQPCQQPARAHQLTSFARFRLLPSFLPELPFRWKSHPRWRTAVPKVRQHRDNSTQRDSSVSGTWVTAREIIPQPSEAGGSLPVLWHFSYYYQGKGLAL